MKIRLSGSLNPQERQVMEEAFQLRHFLLDQLREQLDEKGVLDIDRVMNRAVQQQNSSLHVAETRKVLNMILGAVREEKKRTLRPMQDAEPDLTPHALVPDPAATAAMLLEIRERQVAKIHEGFDLLDKLESTLRRFDDLLLDHSDPEELC